MQISDNINYNKQIGSLSLSVSHILELGGYKFILPGGRSPGALRPRDNWTFFFFFFLNAISIYRTNTHTTYNTNIILTLRLHSTDHILTLLYRQTGRALTLLTILTLYLHLHYIALLILTLFIQQ